MKIHHVGYLTKNLSKSKFLFERSGFIIEKEKAYDALRKIHIVFMLNGGYRIELIEPDGEESSIWGLLERYKNTPHHFCYGVGGTNAAVKKMGWGGTIQCFRNLCLLLVQMVNCAVLCYIRIWG